ncbi:MAG: hypothetical protein NTY48_06510 [Candidatus Diapherotrites archaeon]|nr:hypothetical protein [Candidatus Diapherotrites archaeon]
MQPSTLAPIFGNNTTKAAIIQSLSEKALTLKELHRQVQKVTNKSITYQALHKATKEMITDEILEKIGKEITINKEWIEKVDDFVKNIKDSKAEVKGDSITRVYPYNTFGKFASAIIKLVHDAPNPEKKPGVCITKHAWPTLGLSKTDYDNLHELLKEVKYYDVTTRDTLLDRAFAKTLEKMGKMVKVGSKLEITLDTLCTGDSLFEVVFEKSFSDTIDKIFKKYAVINEDAINDILKNVVAKKTTIKIIHTLSTQQATEIREKILAEFKITK